MTNKITISKARKNANLTQAAQAAAVNVDLDDLTFLRLV